MIHWDAYEIDTQLYEVRHAGVPVKLEPRVYDVLAFLAARRDRVVTVRELRDAIWQGEFVTDSAVTRCISEARRAVGDTGDAQRVIRTVHGRGYRFVAEVNDAREVDGAAVSQRPTRLVAVAAVLIAAALLVIVTQAVRSEPAVRTLAIVPQVTDASDADLQLLALSVADLLDKRLSSVPGLVVRPPDYGAIGGSPEGLPHSDRSDGSPKGLRYRDGSPKGLRHSDGSPEGLPYSDRRDGSPEGLPYSGRPSIVVQAALARSDDGRKGQLVVTLRDGSGEAERATPLGVYDLPFLGPSTDLTTFTRVRDAIVSRLIALLLPAIDLPGADSVRPRDPQAFRLYLLAASRIAQTVICDQGALELVKQSLELDPDYAPGWVLLGWAHDNQATACAQHGSHYDLAMAAAGRARALAPDLPASYPLRTAILVETGRTEEAFAAARDAATRFPESPDVRYSQAYVLTYAGRTAEAMREIDRVLELDPSYLTAGGWTPNVLLYEREWDRFSALLPAMGTPLFRYYHGYALFQSGRRTEARAQVAPSFRQNPHDVFARFGQALTAIIDGKPGEAAAQIRQLSRQRVELASRDGEVTYKQAQLLALAGDVDGGLDELARAVKQGFFCVRCVERDPALDAVRMSDRFRTIVAEAGQRQAAFAARFGFEAP